jgi:predicted Ser/Thr protein kinase
VNTFHLAVLPTNVRTHSIIENELFISGVWVVSDMAFIKGNVTSLEAELQIRASNHGFAPNVYKVERLDDDKVRIIMERIDGVTLADEYGDDPEEIPEWIWDELRHKIEILYDLEGIEYIDITPYNFIQTDKSIYIVDFGDAKYSDNTPMNWFLREFLDGENSWNPDYK